MTKIRQRTAALLALLVACSSADGPPGAPAGKEKGEAAGPGAPDPAAPGSSPSGGSDPQASTSPGQAPGVGPEPFEDAENHEVIIPAATAFARVDPNTVQPYESVPNPLRGAFDATELDKPSTKVGTLILEPEAKTVETCKAVRHYRYEIKTDLPLRCGKLTTMLDVELPSGEKGNAAARFRAKARNDHADAASWGALVTVGSPMMIQATNEFLCPNESSPEPETALGYGRISENRRRILVQALSERSPPCYDGKTYFDDGGVLDVWVEDDACRGKHIVASNLSVNGYADKSFVWTAGQMKETLVVDFNATAAAPRATILASTVAVAADNTNTSCSTGPTPIFRSRLGDTVLKQSKEKFAAKVKLGRVALSADAENQTLTPGLHKVTLETGYTGPAALGVHNGAGNYDTAVIVVLEP